MPKRALVLGGGGARGAYEVGVWEALRELDIEFQMVVGTSVGALNGGLILQDCFDQAKEFWQSISLAAVLDSEIEFRALDSEENRSLFLQLVREVLEKRGADYTPLSTALHTYLDEGACRASPLDYGLVALRYPLLQPVRVWKDQIPDGKLIDYMLASAACFPAFKVMEIGDESFIDGGYYDTLPISMAAERGAEEVIAVDLRSIGQTQPPKLPQRSITRISSYWDLGNMFIFEQERARRNIRLGYLDAMRAFGHYEGICFALRVGESAKNTLTLMQTTADVFERLKISIREPSLRPAVLHVKRRLQANLLRTGPDTVSRREVLHRLMGSDELILPEMLPLLQAMAAEVCGADPLIVYTAAELNDVIFERSQELVREAMEDFTHLFSGEYRLRDAIRLLRSADPRRVTAFLLAELQIFLQGKGRLDPWLMAAVAEKEFAAAVYIAILHIFYDKVGLIDAPDPE